MSGLNIVVLGKDSKLGRHGSFYCVFAPWYNLSTWANEQEKNENVKKKLIMILMPIMKLSQLIKTHQINNITYIILGSITNSELLTLILYVHMNFIIR